MTAREQVCQRIEEIAIVPIVRVASSELALRAVDAILEGGIPIAEITMTVPDALRLIRGLVDRYRGRALIGAGTVLGAREALACIDAGAEFIVSPGTDPSTIAAAKENGVAVMPGALTPTEVITAWNAGADFVKIFPCSALGGAKYLRALKAPLAYVKMMATGGVDISTAPEYLAAGASALGVGSELVDVKALATGRDSVVAERARALVAAVRQARDRLARQQADQT